MRDQFHGHSGDVFDRGSLLDYSTESLPMSDQLTVALNRTTNTLAAGLASSIGKPLSLYVALKPNATLSSDRAALTSSLVLLLQTEPTRPTRRPCATWRFAVGAHHTASMGLSLHAVASFLRYSRLQVLCSSSVYQVHLAYASPAHRPTES